MPGTAVVTIGELSWDVDVASTLEELEQGLAGTEELEAAHGMLFDLGSEQEVAVTTVDMEFPIDVVFIGEDLKVTEVALALEEGHIVYTPTDPCRYFLEVNAGEADDIEVDDDVVITGYTPPAAAEETTLTSIITLVVTGLLVASILGGMVKGFFRR